MQEQKSNVIIECLISGFFQMEYQRRYNFFLYVLSPHPCLLDFHPSTPPFLTLDTYYYNNTLGCQQRHNSRYDPVCLLLDQQPDVLLINLILVHRINPLRFHLICDGVRPTYQSLTTGGNYYCQNPNQNLAFSLSQLRLGLTLLLLSIDGLTDG